MQFQGESYSLGFIDGLFAANKHIDESQAVRYLELSKKLNQYPSSDIDKYIKANYPNILN